MWKIVFLICVTFFAVGLCVLPGGSQDVDISDGDFQSALRFAVANYNKGNNADAHLFKVVKILSAKVQVVGGYSYTTVVKLGRTNCKKDEPNTGCTVYTNPPKAQIYLCKFVVLSRPWLQVIQVLQVVCSEHNLFP